MVVRYLSNLLVSFPSPISDRTVVHIGSEHLRWAESSRLAP